MSLRWFGIGISCLALLGVAACSGQKSPPKGSLNLYTARHYDADQKIYKAFEDKTGIRINRLEMSPEQLIERMKTEGDASPADVILMADAGALYRAEQAGLFQPSSSSTLTAKIPAQFRDPKGLWFGFSRRARVIAYDTTKVKPEEVANFAALATPRFKGKICVRSSDNVYNLSLLGAMIENWGKDRAEAWAKAVVANMARPPEGGDIEQICAVGAGVCEVAITNTYYYLRIKNSEAAADKQTAAKVVLAFPDLNGKGVHMNISGGGLARYATHKAEAEAFLNFLTSPEAQAIFANANFEYPMIEGAAGGEHELPKGIATDPTPVSVYGQRQSEAQSVFNTVGWR